MKNQPSKQTIIQNGEGILYDGLKGWILRTNPSSDSAWILLEDNEPESVSWKSIWADHQIRPAPDARYAQMLGIGLPQTLPPNPQHPLDRIACPFCSRKYTDRFEIRPSKNHCTTCLGQGERAMYADALVDAWLDDGIGLA